MIAISRLSVAKNGGELIRARLVQSSHALCLLLAFSCLLVAHRSAWCAQTPTPFTFHGFRQILFLFILSSIRRPQTSCLEYLERSFRRIYRATALNALATAARHPAVMLAILV